MKLNRTWAMAVAIVMALTLSLSGTLAYLQDSDSAVNVMTLGNVNITLNEQQRVIENDGTWTTTLEGFEQGKTLYPIVGSAQSNNVNVTSPYDDEITWALVDENTAHNYVDKIVTVTNDKGSSDAYVRVLFGFPADLDDAQSAANMMLHWNHSASTPSGMWTHKDCGVQIVEGGVKYNIYNYTYNYALSAGETTEYPAITGIYLDKRVDADTNADGTITYHMTLADGTRKTATFEADQDVQLLVVAQGVQAAGFDSADAALTAAFGEISATNNPWAKDIVVTDEIGITDGGTYNLEKEIYTIDSAYFHTQKVEEPVTINGNGATVEGIATSVDSFQWEGGTIPAMSAIFSSTDGSKVTVNDLTFTGTMSSVMAGHYVNSTYNNYNTEFNNVNIVDTEVVSFSANTAPALCVYGTAVLNNCNVYGTTLSELDTDPMWPVYDIAVVNYSDTTLNNTKVGSILVWNQAKLTVAEGSEVDTIIIRGNMNTSKYGVTIKAGATVDAIDLSAITNKTKVNFTIEDGANVGSIVANGVTYDSIAAWQAAE